MCNLDALFILTQHVTLIATTLQGLSNVYNLDALSRIYNDATVKPAVLQVRLVS